MQTRILVKLFSNSFVYQRKLHDVKDRNIHDGTHSYSRLADDSQIYLAFVEPDCDTEY